MHLAFKKYSAVLMLAAPAMMLAACGSSSGSTQAATPPPSAVTTPPPSAVTTPPPSAVTTPPTTTNNSTPPVASSSPSWGPSPSVSGDTSRANNSTFVLGENVGLKFKATGLTAGIVTTLAIKVADGFGSEVATASQSLSADSSGNATVVYSPPASKYGYYRVDASLPDGTTLARLGTRPAGFITYAVVPDPATRQNYGDSGSRFGMQGGFSSAMGPVMSYLGVRYLLAGPGWDTLEPHQAGQFATAHSEAVANGLKYPTSTVNNHAAWPTYAIPLITTGEIPAWAMNAGTGTVLRPYTGPLNAEGVIGFPEFTKARASGVAADFPAQSTHYYQMTWEPAIPVLFGGTPAELVQYFQVAYSAIHQADAKAMVMGPTVFPVDPVPMEQLWSAGLAKYIDAVSVHPYVKYPPEQHGLIAGIRTQMALATAAKGHSMPFLGTEHGYSSGIHGSYGTGSELRQGLADVRSTIILLGEGFKVDFAFYIADYYAQSANSTTQDYFGYYWNLNPAINFGTDKIAPKPAAPAYAAMTYMLDGSTSIGPLTNLHGTQVGYHFTRSGKNILALWDYTANTTMDVPVSAATAKVCDWMGNCRTVAPNAGTLTLKVGVAPLYVIF